MLHLKLLRKERGLTQKQLGNIFGLTESAISGYELGKRLPDVKTVIQLAEYFGVSIDFLLDVNENRMPPGTYLNTTIEQSMLLEHLYSLPEEDIAAFRHIITQYARKNKE